VIHGDIITSVEDYKNKILNPESYKLSQNFPNPFNPETIIIYTIQKPGIVQINIFNVNGQLVKSLLSEDKLTGEYLLRWDGANNLGKKVSSGIYLDMLKAGRKFITKKMILLRYLLNKLRNKH